MNTRRKLGVVLSVGCLGILLLLIGGAVLLSSSIPPVGSQLPAHAPSLVVNLTFPTNASVIALNQTTEVLAEALGSAPIVRLELWIDGALAQDNVLPQASAQRRFSTTWTWMPIEEGVHMLFVRARDAKANVAQSDVVYVKVTPAETFMLVSTGETTAPLPAGGFPDPESSQPPAPPPQEPSAPPPGDPPPLEPSLPSPIKFWISKDFLKFLVPTQPPQAPNLWAKAQDCSVKLILQDNSDNEDGFFIYRLAPGSLSFERIATLDAHASTDIFAYLDPVWLGNWLYYVTAFNTKGESPPSEMATIHSDELGIFCPPASAPQLTLSNAKLTPTEQVDKAYCYVSINGGSWTRIPPSPDFLLPDSIGAFDMSPWFNTLPPDTTMLDLECWGWQGDTLTYLGEAQQTFDLDQPPEEMIGANFKFNADILEGLHGWQFFNSENYLLGAPLGLELTASPEKCIDHMPPLAAAFGGALLCSDAIKDGYAVLTWEWTPLQSWEGSQQSIKEPDGYHVYRLLYPTPALVDEVKGGDMHVTMFPWPPAVWPDPNAPQVNNSNCYVVRAFANIGSGVIESDPSNMVCLDILPPVALKTITLPADATYWRVRYKYEDCGGTYGTGAYYHVYPPPDGSIVVGHEHSDDHCDYWNAFYRGAVWFDLSSIQAPIYHAELKFWRQESYYSDGYWAGVTSCASYLMLAKEDWRGDPYGDKPMTIPATDLKPLSGTSPYTQFSIDVTNIANAWRQGTLPNYGFVLRGPVEYIAGHVEINGDSEYYCASVYDNFRLEVTYFVEDDQ